MARAVLGGAVVNQPISENQREGLWSIVITVLRGEGADVAAERARNALELVGGISDAYVERRGDTHVVAYGRYKDPMSDQAQGDLVRIRATVIDGKQPYLGAALTPPPFETAGNIPQFNLSIAKDFPANRNCIYTLQVAQYRRLDDVSPTMAEREEFRRAAEGAAVTLRREGEEAYYYHGPRMSVVTIGMFTDKEYRTQNTRSANDPRSTVVLTRPVESLEIKQLRERQPYNLVNGQAMKTRTKGSSTAQMQRSIMVEIPK